MIWPIVQELAKSNSGVTFLKIDVDEAQVSEIEGGRAMGRGRGAWTERTQMYPRQGARGSAYCSCHCLAASAPGVGAVYVLASMCVRARELMRLCATSCAGCCSAQHD